MVSDRLCHFQQIFEGQCILHSDLSWVVEMCETAQAVDEDVTQVGHSHLHFKHTPFIMLANKQVEDYQMPCCFTLK